MEKLTKFDDQVSHLFLSICEKVNEIVDYINKQQLAASGSDTSRTTPNPEKGSEIENLFKLYNLKIDDYIYSRLIEDLEILFQANGETPVMDNPVAPLDDLIEKILNNFGIPSNNGWAENKLNKIFKEHQGARTTDKENLEIEMVKVKRNNIIGDFCIGKYQVTQGQWEKIMGNNPSYFKGDNLPVENVSWNDVQEFLLKLNAQTGLNYRLPTQVEWEYAARGGNQSKGYKYSGSNNLKGVAWFEENSDSKTHPVGALKPNELGLYDMSGNVWEWCEDWYLNYNFPVMRGGSWDVDVDGCRVYFLSYAAPTYRLNDLGFRLAI